MLDLGYGMPQLIDVDELEENFQLCCELGLDFVELNCQLPSCQPEGMNVQYLNRLKKQYGVGSILRLPEDLDLGHFNRHVREAHLKVLEEAIGVADRLRCKILTLRMNPGVDVVTPEGRVALYKKYESQYLMNIRTSLELVDIWLGGTGVQIAIDTTDELERGYLQKAVSEMLNSGRFCLTFDANRHFQDSGFIRQVRSFIKHVRVHESVLAQDELSFHIGEADWDKALKLPSEHQASLLIDVKTREALEKAVGHLKEKEYLR